MPRLFPTRRIVRAAGVLLLDLPPLICHNILLLLTIHHHRHLILPTILLTCLPVLPLENGTATATVTVTVVDPVTALTVTTEGHLLGLRPLPSILLVLDTHHWLRVIHLVHRPRLEVETEDTTHQVIHHTTTIIQSNGKDTMPNHHRGRIQKKMESQCHHLPPRSHVENLIWM